MQTPTRELYRYPVSSSHASSIQSKFRERDKHIIAATKTQLVCILGSDATLYICSKSYLHIKTGFFHYRLLTQKSLIILILLANYDILDTIYEVVKA